MQIYERISEANIIKYGTEHKRTLSIIINQYSDRTHFIYEILQNAEDAGASEIRFHLKHDALEIYHDGRPFDEKDIDGVCGIADGTKGDGTRIGHFGIGFKSVYCYTEIPQIYSGIYHFRIKDQLFPEEIDAFPGLLAGDTCMILPFNRPDVPANTAYAEIRDALSKKITADSVLMLDNIERVDILIDGLDYTISITKLKNKISSLNKGIVYAMGVSSVTIFNDGKEKSSNNDYLFFSDNNLESSAVVYRVGGADGKQLLPVKNSKIYAYFPTAREAHQNFYIHAPFDTTPARDNFKEGAEYGKHNLQLTDNICELITDSLVWMRDNGYLSFSGFNTVFPIYEYEQHDILYGIYDNSIAIISSGEELLPTNIPGTYKAIENICVPQATVIVDVFNDDDLHQLISGRKYWIAKEISTEAYAELRRFLNKNFELQTLDWSSLVLKMNAQFLKQKNIGWMEKLMVRIESYCRRSSYDSHFIDVSRIPFVRITNGEQICARDESGRLQVYLNNHDIARYKIDRGFLNNEAIKSFYRNALQIPEYNVVQETLETILPYYQSANVGRSIQENIEDLKTIKDAIYVNPAIVEKLSDKYIVTDGKKWFRPTELYIRSDDVRSGFSLMQGIIEFRYLAEAYFDDTIVSIKLDTDFFKRIGCNAAIRELTAAKSEYLKAIENYLGRSARDNLSQRIFSKTYVSQKLNWAFYYEGFDKLFRSMSFEKSLKIARFLNPNAVKFDVRGEIVGADDQHFSGRNVDTAVAYTMLGLVLSHEKWIYVNGSDQPQRPIDIDRSDLRIEYRQVKRIIEILPFKEVKNPLIDYLSANISDKNKLESVKSLLSNPEELVRIATAFAKSKAQEEAKKGKAKGIYDLIQSGDRTQQKSDKRASELEVNPISETAKKKREDNLDKILAESMNQEIYVAKGLQFTSRASNEEERQFLLSEYNGVCQICGKQIVKHDGEEYFEAINVIKFNEMNAKLARSSKLGWNSLCLCPNCAAEYNYCSKKISSIYEQVMHTEVVPDSDVPIEIKIELPLSNIRTIHYSPRHFIALKEAFKIFSKDE